MAELVAEIKIDGCEFARNVIKDFADGIEFKEDVPEEFKKGFYHFAEAVDKVLNEKFVPHGMWVSLEPEIGLFACSECDHRILRSECNYCPNCGAKMDGDKYGNL